MGFNFSIALSIPRADFEDNTDSARAYTAI